MRQIPLRIAVAGVLSVLGTVMVPGWNGAYSQPYPSRPIHVVVPFASGGGSDHMGRLVAQKLTESFGQQTIVENRPGAGGRVGTLYVSESAPDGYTLLLAGSGPLIFAPALYPKLRYDVQKDLRPIIMVASTAYLLVAHPSLPVRSLKQLITLCKVKPGVLNYSSSGLGAAGHLSAELFQAMAKAQMVHIPYKGTAPALIAVISGDVDLMFSNLLPAMPAIQSGRLRPIAITSLKRSSMLPEVPTVAESGLPGFRVTTVYGMLAPARTPSNIVARLNAELLRALQSPDTRKGLEADGSEVITSTPEEFDKFVEMETKKWLSVIRGAAITPELQ